MEKLFALCGNGLSVSTVKFGFMSLLQELRRSATLKQQLEVYKRQGMEQQSKLTEETKRADKAEFEAKRLQDKVSTLQREKEV